MPPEAENEACSVAALKAAQKKPRPSIYLGLLPVLMFLLSVIGLWLLPPALVIFEPRFLLPSLNTILFLATGTIAYIALRSYLLAGHPPFSGLAAGF
jgi:hypothetical protein